MAISPEYQLWEFMKKYFNDDEVVEFAFKYFPEVLDDFGDGMSESDKIRNLVLYCKRRKKNSDLLQALNDERPESFHELDLASLEEATISAESPPDPILAKPETLPDAGFDIAQNNETAPTVFVHEKTGLEFIHIPAGEFISGEENEERKIPLPEYWISKTPITNKVYKQFIDANPDYKVPKIFLGVNNWDKDSRNYPEGRAEHPVTSISRKDAQAFCQWAGLSLPTTLQWEKAARGTDGRVFPWGNTVVTKELCNFGKNENGTTPVGRYSPQGDSPYGCVDMSGNVCEWCLDDANLGSNTRNGAWDKPREHMRITFHTSVVETWGYDGTGFRAVMNSSPSA